MARVPAGKTVTVTADQAHAWAEYYEPRLGMWIVLEATPASGGADLPTEPSIPQPGMETTPAPPTSPQATQPQPTEPVEKSPEGGNSGWLWFLPAALIPVLLWGQWYLRREVNRRRLARGTANRRALAIWTVLTRCCRLLKLTPSPEAEALACKAFFSQHTLTPADLEVFDTYLASSVAELRQKPWWQQLYFRLIWAAY
jgi:hypothetical protein